MAYLITLTTTKFDPSKEPPNPPNLVPGESILRWLSDTAFAGEGDPTDGEDWGWYMHVEHNGQRNMLGGVCLLDEAAGWRSSIRLRLEITQRQLVFRARCLKNTHR